MIVYIWPNGRWMFDWEVAYYRPNSKDNIGLKRVDLNKFCDVHATLTDIEIKACIEAVDEAEARRSRLFRNSK